MRRPLRRPPAAHAGARPNAADPRTGSRPAADGMKSWSWSAKAGWARSTTPTIAAWKAVSARSRKSCPALSRTPPPRRNLEQSRRAIPHRGEHSLAARPPQSAQGFRLLLHQRPRISGDGFCRRPRPSGDPARANSARNSWKRTRCWPGPPSCWTRCEYLHSHDPPVLHRDIKPSNIKLTPRGIDQTGRLRPCQSPAARR